MSWLALTRLGLCPPQVLCRGLVLLMGTFLGVALSPESHHLAADAEWELGPSNMASFTLRSSVLWAQDCAQCTELMKMPAKWGTRNSEPVKRRKVASGSVD